MHLEGKVRLVDERKVLIVEGITDKAKLENIIKEQVEIICTYGTISFDWLEQLIEQYIDDDVFILVDADKSGEQLRRQLKQAFPIASNLYIDKKYREVATTPDSYLASILVRANFEVHEHFLG